MRKKLVPIPGGGNVSITKEALRDFKANIDVYKEATELIAEVTRFKFLALKKKGFSDQEALELSKTIP